MRFVFLILAIWGAVHPMYFFVQWFLAEGWSLFALVDAWRANLASTGLTWDLVISAVVLIIWILSEVAKTRNLRSLWAVAATICIGVSCGLPLYLYLRNRVVYARDGSINRNL
ncbi:K+-transporting ATPase, A chain [Loktanella sp. D2R18]|uniref:DUF2834 domain-containing protein n=1 Tax=Rhodobacterales TaxID=204455 RepID=UPI000DEA892D|nr:MULTISPECIES: DUF2834 domain-containing protein [Rhodobacterales]MDO6590790.1 DUF2834 domain-containing protein [Yoonia sp. 1_MG-2023]RBW43229.1 K+-transporting ATPase, A chain [Loktanella sp. D2R18]